MMPKSVLAPVLALIVLAGPAHAQFLGSTANEMLIEKWTGSIWEREGRFVASYDDLGNQTRWIYQSWRDGWTPNTRYTAEFVGTDMVRRTYEQIDSVSGDWIPAARSSFEYDAGREVTQIDEGWSGEWIQIARHSSEYEADRLVRRVVEAWGGSEWQLVSRWEQVWDSLGRLIAQASSNWSGSGWSLFREVSISYHGDTDRRRHTVRRYSSGSAWIVDSTSYAYSAQSEIETVFRDRAPSSRTKRRLNTAGKTTLRERELWHSNDWLYATSAQITYDDTDTLRIGRLWSRWDSTEAKWRPESRSTSIYEASTSIVAESVRPEVRLTADVFPNPASTGFRVLLGRNEHGEAARIQLVDAAGRVVWSILSDDGRADLDASTLADGQYFVRIQTGEHLVTRAITVIH